MSVLKGMLVGVYTDGRWSAEASWLLTAGPSVVRAHR